MADNREPKTYTLDTHTTKVLASIKKTTKAPMARLIDEAVEDLGRKYQDSGKWEGLEDERSATRGA